MLRLMLNVSLPYHYCLGVIFRKNLLYQILSISRNKAGIIRAIQILLGFDSRSEDTCMEIENDSAGANQAKVAQQQSEEEAQSTTISKKQDFRRLNKF